MAKKFNMDIFKGNTCARCDRDVVDKLGINGDVNSEILVIVNQPTGLQSDEKSMFKGSGYREINTMMKRIRKVKKAEGKGYAILPAVLCHGAKPTPEDVDNCGLKFKKEIAKMKNLKHVIVFGTSALRAVVSDLWTSSIGSYDRWTGHAIPIPSKGYMVYPLYDPIRIINEVREGNKEYEITQYNYMTKVARSINRDVRPKAISLDKAEILTDEDEICEYLDSLKDTDVAYDYEGSGLKPQNKGHFIYSLAIANDDRAVSFLTATKRIEKKVKRVLRDPSVGLIAANVKHELNWTRTIWGFETRNVKWDTMIAAHILDTRPGTKGLKFQVFVQLGIASYESNMKEAFKTKSNNAINKIKLLDKHMLLKYGATDAIGTWELYKHQLTIMDKHDKLAYKLMHDGTLALSRTECNGMRVDRKILKKYRKELDELIATLRQGLDDTKLGKKWRHKYKDKFNYASDDQLRWMIYEVLDQPVTEKTDSGLSAVDKDVLAGIDNEFIRTYARMKGFLKVRDTFIANIANELSDRDTLHPSFQLHTTRTYRSSSKDPNFQNQPIREKEYAKYIRGILFPHKGHRLMEVDFSGVEVRIAAAYHKDPVMLEYINGGGDMHYDVAKQAFMVDDDEMTGSLRKVIKAGFVFSQFYGSSYKNCAKVILNSVKELKLATKSGMPIMEHLASKGINTTAEYVKHVKWMQDDFWNVRFGVYGQWKKDMVKRYRETGKYRGHTHFTYRGAIGPRGVTNYPVQGSAFHVLLQCLVWVDAELIKRKLKSKLMGQIHDSLVFSVAPGEEYEIACLCKEVMEQRIVEEWEFINTPLDIEFEITEPDCSWFTKEEITFEEIGERYGHTG